MIIRCYVPQSRKGKALCAKRLRGLKQKHLNVTRMWGRASQPGLARVSTHYRSRV